MAYVTITRGSPRVVPSSDGMVSPLMNRSAFMWYVLISTVAREVHLKWMLCSATWRFRLLIALAASTRRMPWVVGLSNISRIACTAAAHPAC